MLEERKRRDEEIRQEALLKLNEWKAGEGSALSAFRALPVGLRIKDKAVETSHGARVKISSAKALLTKVLEGKIVNGEKIDGFVVSRIKDGIAVIGCHRIEISEARRVLNV